MSEERKESVGNYVAMREWLERLDALMQLPPHTDDKEEARKMIRAALAAPQRNCDRFKTAEEAEEAWLELDDEDDSATEPFEWIFARAEEGGEE